MILAAAARAAWQIVTRALPNTPPRNDFGLCREMVCPAQASAAFVGQANIW